MLGKLLFPKQRTLVAFIIGVALVAAARILPIVRGLVSLGCTVYTLGYFVQRIYLGFGKKAASPTPPPAAPTAAKYA